MFSGIPAHIKDDEALIQVLTKIHSSVRSSYIKDNGYLDKIRDGRDLAFVIEMLPVNERVSFIEENNLAPRIKNPLPPPAEEKYSWIENPSNIIKHLPLGDRFNFVFSHNLADNVTYNVFAGIMKEIPEKERVGFLERNKLKNITLQKDTEDHDLSKVIELIPMTLRWNYICSPLFRTRIITATGLSNILKILPEGMRVSSFIGGNFFDKIDEENALDRAEINKIILPEQQAIFWERCKERRFKKIFEDTTVLFGKHKDQSTGDSAALNAAKEKFLNALKDLAQKTLNDHKLGSIGLDDALLIAKETAVLVTSITTKDKTDPSVLFNSIKIFRDKTAPFKGASWSWLTILEAVIGAAIGVAMGIALTLVTGPVAVIIAASVIGAVGAACGAGHSLWRIAADKPLLKTANTAEQVVSLRA